MSETKTLKLKLAYIALWVLISLAVAVGTFLFPFKYVFETRTTAITIAWAIGFLLITSVYNKFVSKLATSMDIDVNRIRFLELTILLATTIAMYVAFIGFFIGLIKLAIFLF